MNSPEGRLIQQQEEARETPPDAVDMSVECALHESSQQPGRCRVDEEVEQLVLRLSQAVTSRLRPIGRMNDCTDPSVNAPEQLQSQLTGMMEQTPDPLGRQQLEAELMGEAERLLGDQSSASPRQFWSHWLRYLRAREEACRGGEPAVDVAFVDGDWEHGLPLRVDAFDQANEKLDLGLELLATGQQRSHLLRLGEVRGDRVDLTLRSIGDVRFGACQGVRLLSVVCTFVRHLDLRQLLGLEELRLNNTNIRRLNLVNQGNLKTLYCNYTLVDYLDVSGLLLLKQLHIEYSGQVKAPRTNANNELFIDEKQVTNEYQCKSWIQGKKRVYAFSYLQKKENEQTVWVQLPRNCDMLIDRNVKQYNHVTLDQGSVYQAEIVDYPNLARLWVSGVICNKFWLENLPVLQEVSISSSMIPDVQFTVFPGLRKISISYCHYLYRVQIEKCDNVEEIGLNDVKITQLDLKGLRHLKKLDINDCAIKQIDVSTSGELEELSIKNAKLTWLDVCSNKKLKKICIDRNEISQLDVTQLTQLQYLSAVYASLKQIDLSMCAQLQELFLTGTQIPQVDVSRNRKLKTLCIEAIKIAQLNVSQLWKLKKLYAGSTNISELYLFDNIELEMLNVDYTKVSALNLCSNKKLKYLSIEHTGISKLDVNELSELEILLIAFTSISRLDVHQNVQLKELDVSNTEIYRLKVTALKRLSRLRIQGTKIKWIDLARNTQLSDVMATRRCGIKNCCCYFQLVD